MKARILRLHRAAWRQRYGEELEDLLRARSLTFSLGIDLVRGALDAHLHPKLLRRRSFPQEGRK